MRLIDEQFTKTPFYGVRRMTTWLKRQGHQVNRKRIQRLMRLTIPEARAQLGAYFRFYNEERPHEALGYRTPHEVSYGTRSALLPASETVVLIRTGSRSSLLGLRVKLFFRPVLGKWLLVIETVIIVTKSGPRMHLQMGPSLSS